MFSERGNGEPPDSFGRLSLQSYNLRVDLEVTTDEWRDQVLTRQEPEPVAWAVWLDRPAYSAGQQVTLCGWVSRPGENLTCELLGRQARLEVTPEGAFLLRFAAPAQSAIIKLALAGHSREMGLVVSPWQADFTHDGPCLRVQAPALAGQAAELQLQRLPIPAELGGAYDDFTFAAAEPARVVLRETFDAQGRLSVVCNSKAAGIFEVAGRGLYHRWLHLPEGRRVGRRFCRTLDAFDQVILGRFGQVTAEISREDLRGGSDLPALGMDLDPPGPFAPGEEAVLRVTLNGSSWGVGYLCWSEGSRLISWGIVSFQQGLNGLRAQIPADCLRERLNLSLHLLTPEGRLESRLGVVIRPSMTFECEWAEVLAVRLTGSFAPQAQVLIRIVSTPWAERQPGWIFPEPFQVLPAEAKATQPRAEPECAATSAPTWTLLARVDDQGILRIPVARAPGSTVHLSTRDVQGFWVQAYFEG